MQVDRRLCKEGYLCRIKVLGSMTILSFTQAKYRISRDEAIRLRLLGEHGAVIDIDEV